MKRNRTTGELVRRLFVVGVLVVIIAASLSLFIPSANATYIGGYVNGVKSSSGHIGANKLEFQMVMPHNYHEVSAVYFVFQQAWDTGNALYTFGWSVYDPGGSTVVWSVYWTIKTNCANTNGGGSAIDYLLLPGHTYRYEMEKIGASVTFRVYEGPTLRWSKNVAAPSGVFDTAGTYTCSDGFTYDNYVLVEDIGQTTPQNEPDWDFVFVNPKADGVLRGVAQWVGYRFTIPGYPPIPAEVQMTLGTCTLNAACVTINNQWWGQTMTNNINGLQADEVSFSRTTPSWTYTATVTRLRGQQCVDCVVTFTIESFTPAGSGWFISIANGLCTVPGRSLGASCSTTVTLDPPANAVVGNYVLVIRSSQGGFWTNYRSLIHLT